MGLTTRTLLVDADQMVYACGFAADKEPLSHALQLVKKQIKRICEDNGTRSLKVYIGGKGNFRDEIADTKGYKANRPNRKPSHYEDIRRYLQDSWSAEVVEGMEADDAVSIALYSDYQQAEGDPSCCRHIVCSPDKDLNNTPGWHYNPTKGTLKFITLNQADRHFYYQLLTGDAVDNVPGCPGIGPVKAKAVMKSDLARLDPLEAVTEAYFRQCSPKGWTQDDIYEHMLEQGRLLWMIREFNHKPVMWEYEHERFKGYIPRIQARWESGTGGGHFPHEGVLRGDDRSQP